MGNRPPDTQRQLLGCDSRDTAFENHDPALFRKGKATQLSSKGTTDQNVNLHEKDACK
jgi:hypothetical protein